MNRMMNTSTNMNMNMNMNVNTAHTSSLLTKQYQARSAQQISKPSTVQRTTIRSPMMPSIQSNPNSNSPPPALHSFVTLSHDGFSPTNQNNLNMRYQQSPNGPHHSQNAPFVPLQKQPPQQQQLQQFQPQQQNRNQQHQFQNNQPQPHQPPPPPQQQQQQQQQPQRQPQQSVQKQQQQRMHVATQNGSPMLQLFDQLGDDYNPTLKSPRASIAPNTVGVHNWVRNAVNSTSQSSKAEEIISHLPSSASTAQRSQLTIPEPDPWFNIAPPLHPPVNGNNRLKSHSTPTRILNPFPATPDSSKSTSNPVISTSPTSKATTISQPSKSSFSNDLPLCALGAKLQSVAPNFQLTASPATCQLPDDISEELFLDIGLTSISPSFPTAEPKNAPLATHKRRLSFEDGIDTSLKKQKQQPNVADNAQLQVTSVDNQNELFASPTPADVIPPSSPFTSTSESSTSTWSSPSSSRSHNLDGPARWPLDSINQEMHNLRESNNRLQTESKVLTEMLLESKELILNLKSTLSSQLNEMKQVEAGFSERLASLEAHVKDGLLRPPVACNISTFKVSSNDSTHMASQGIVLVDDLDDYPADSLNVDGNPKNTNLDPKSDLPLQFRVSAFLALLTGALGIDSTMEFTQNSFDIDVFRACAQLFSRRNSRRRQMMDYLARSLKSSSY